MPSRVRSRSESTSNLGKGGQDVKKHLAERGAIEAWCWKVRSCRRVEHLAWPMSSRIALILGTAVVVLIAGAAGTRCQQADSRWVSQVTDGRLTARHPDGSRSFPETGDHRGGLP